MSERNLVVLLGVSLVGISCARGLAQTGSLDWFEQTWREASRWQPEQPILLRVDGEAYAYVDRAELETLRAKVGNATSGREKGELDRMEYDLAHPKVEWTARVCTDGKRLRYGAFEPSGNAQLQFALSDRDDWLMVEAGKLRIAPPDIEKPEYGVRNYYGTADSIVRTTIWAGLGDGRSDGLKPLSSTIDGNVWTATVGLNGKPPAVSVIEGSVATPGQACIAGMVVTRRMLADERVRAATPLGTIEYSGWTHSPELGRSVVESTRWMDAKGRVTQRMKLIEIRRVSPAEFASLLAIPEDGKPDPWMGTVVLKSIQDVRPDHLSQVLIQNGTKTSIPLEVPVGPSSSDRTWMFVVLSIVLGFGAVALAWHLRRFR